MDTDICKLCIPVEFTVYQNASCIHRQSPHHTYFQVAMVRLFWAQKRKLDAKTLL